MPSNTTVNGTAVPGLLQSISTGTPSVGVQTQSPAANVKPPTNTTSTPVPTTSVKDLSGQYASVAGVNGAPATIYNKTTGQGYSDPASFFKDAGVDSFNNLKFDTGWTPPTNTSSGLQMPGTPAAVSTSPSTGLLPTLATQTPASTPTSPTTQNSYGLLNAPNNGTTGVSQGNLINTQAQQINNPDWTAANTQLQTDQNAYAQAKQNVGNTAFGASEGIGAGGALDTLYNQKIANDTALLNAAIAKQGANTSSLSAATSANTPITNPQTGGLVSPSANTTTGGTTSGAQNLNSQLTITPNATGPGTASSYSAGGQTFATPAALSAWVNQQVGNPNATNASNVFQYLQQNGGNTGNASGTSGLNPISQVSTIAQQVINGQLSPAAAASMGGSVSNWSTLLNQALIQANGGQPIDTSALQAKYDANQAVQNQQAQQVAGFQSASNQAKNLATQFGDLVTKYNLNPNELNLANGIMQSIASNTSDPRYQALSNYVNDIAATYAQVLGTGGQATDFKTQLAGSFINQLASGSSLQATLASIDQQAQAKIAGVQTPSTTGQSSGSAPAGFGWNG